MILSGKCLVSGLFSKSAACSSRQGVLRQFRKQADRTIKSGEEGPNQPFIRVDGLSDPPKWNQLLKPVVFTVAVSGVSFAGAAIWQYENMRINIKKQGGFFEERFNNPFRRNPPSTQPKAGNWRNELNAFWNNLSEGHKVFAPILAINVAVFAAWRIPAMRHVMMRHFCSNPSSKSGNCMPMLLSAFSHYSVFHLAANMYVLQSFSTPIVDSLGKEQFVAVYFSSAVFSSLCSYVHKVATGRAGMSLGASGAICAILGMYGTLVPDSLVQIVFLPMIQFTASTAIKGIMALDTAGIVAGWQFFDHAAHLGGVVMGIWWVRQGHDLIWAKREPIMTWWHENVRSKKPKS